MSGDLPPPDPSQRNRYESDRPYPSEPASYDRLRRVLIAVGGVALVIFAICLGLVVLRDPGDSSPRRRHLRHRAAPHHRAHRAGQDDVADIGRAHCYLRDRGCCRHCGDDGAGRGRADGPDDDPGGPDHHRGADDARHRATAADPGARWSASLLAPIWARRGSEHGAQAQHDGRCTGAEG